MATKEGFPLGPLLSNRTSPESWKVRKFTRTMKSIKIWRRFPRNREMHPGNLNFEFHDSREKNDIRREQRPRSSYFCDVEINNKKAAPGTTYRSTAWRSNDMSEGRTHRGSSDLGPARKRGRRQRWADEGKRVAMMGALIAVMLVGYAASRQE